MGIQKEKELYLAELLERGALKQDEIDDLDFKTEISAFHSSYLSARFIDNINFGWSAWQAAKAQAVPEGFVLVKKRNLIGNPNVDFLQAPRWAKYWLMDGHSKKYWWSSVRPKKDMDLLCYVWGGQHFVGEAPSFGFAGPWNESLTSKKAMLEAQEPAND